MNKVLTVGVYDLLHWGHFELFRRAKELAGPDGKLVVAVQKDEWVTKFKFTVFAPGEDQKHAYRHPRRRNEVETNFSKYHEIQ